MSSLPSLGSKCCMALGIVVLSSCSEPDSWEFQTNNNPPGNGGITVYGQSALAPDAMELFGTEVRTGAEMPARTTARLEVLPPHPGTMQSRVMIDAPVGSPGFAATLRELEGDRSGRARPARAFRLIGEIPLEVVASEPIDAGTSLVTVRKNGARHDIDRGDFLAIARAGEPVLWAAVLADPNEDRGRPDAQRVTVLVSATAALADRHASVSLVAEFDAGAGDDPANFVVFDPEPLPLASGAPSPSNQNVSPLAAAVLRFNAPIDLAAVRTLDNAFFATRDLLDPAAQSAFVQSRNIDPATFKLAKYYTPHLIHARVADAGGPDNVLRLRPPLGFYLDDAMRQADEGVPFEQKSFRYFLHLVGGSNGLKAGDGDDLDLGGTPSVVVPFSLDTRSNGGAPLFADNLAFTVARRFADPDEDEQPSYDQPSEVQNPGAPINVNAYPQADLFGAVSLSPDGELLPRPSSRARLIVDDLNQVQPPPQSTPQRYCAEAIQGESQVSMASAFAKFGAPIQNPTNPYGSRTQMVWREIDMSLSRTDPHDFNLDVEAMYWGVFTQFSVVADTFDRTSLFLGHAERRPEPCVGSFSALPSFWDSGLSTVFGDNYVANNDLTGARESSPSPHAAFLDRPLVIDPSNLVLEPRGVNRYMPLPAFQKPYFVWRDERVTEQGGDTEVGSDTTPAFAYEPYILSPFLAGEGRSITMGMTGPQFAQRSWSNENETLISDPSTDEVITGGSVGAIALPLLADFQTMPSPMAIGLNGLQVALAVQSAPTPFFRAYSGGGLTSSGPVLVDPSTPAWQTASGGISPSSGLTLPADNSVYWTMVDVSKRMSIATAGFVDLTNPHRMPATASDPRLGPFSTGPIPMGSSLIFAHDLQAPLGGFPASTEASVEFRAAGAVDPRPWRATVEQSLTPPDETNFPLDPLKAGDAHIRKYDDRSAGGQPRNAWTYLYNRNVTDYVADPAQLADPTFLAQFAGPNEQFAPDDVRYVNWRIVLRNSEDGSETPVVDSFVMSYRFE